MGDETLAKKYLKLDDRIGKLIDRLQDICASNPAHICPDALRRYRPLLEKLRNFRMRHWGYQANGDEVNIRDLTIGELDEVLQRWVMSYYENDHPSMLPTFALDTAFTVVAHIRGFAGIGLRFDPVMKGEYSHRFPESRFKADFTRFMANPLIVLATIPTGAGLSIYKQPVKDGGAQVLFGFRRCYLSQTPAYEDALLFPSYATATTNLLGDFWIHGDYFVSQAFHDKDYRPNPLLIRNFLLQHPEQFACEEYIVHGLLPGKWITACGQISGRKMGPMIAIPNW